MIQWGVLSTLLLSLAIPTMAQEAGAPAPGGGRQGRQGRQGGGRFGGRMTLATVPLANLKAGLQLTDEQAKKIEDIHKKANADARALRQPGQPPSAETMQQMREIGTKADKEIESLLTDEQKKKAAPLVKELGAYASVGLPPAALEALKLTDDQKKKIMDIAAKLQKDVAALPQEEQRQKGREIRQASRAETTKLLTEEQKKELEKFQQANGQRRRNAGGNNQ